MWRILKAEIINDKLNIMLIYFFAIICFVITWFGISFDRNRAPLAMMIMVVATLLMSFVCEKKRIAQRRGHRLGLILWDCFCRDSACIFF